MHPLRVKICGVTRPADVAVCAAAGVDAVGVNFHPGSPRYVDPRSAQPVLRAIPPLMAGVGVFVGLPFRQVAALAYQLGLRGVQYHGEHGEPEDAFPFSFVLLGLGFVLILLRRDRRALHDLIGRSRVVYAWDVGASRSRFIVGNRASRQA